MAAIFHCARRLRNSTYNPLSRAKRFYCAKENVKVYASHTFYKGKSAMSIHPGRPIFKTNEEGAFVLEKEGTMFLEFAPSTSPRQYDWARKQVLALSVVEMGTIVALTMSESIEFFHDPHLGSSDSGKVRKCLKIEPMADKGGFFFNINVANKPENLDIHLTVPLTKGEFSVLRSSFNFMIPYLMGWHGILNPSNIQLGENSRVDPILEWSK